MTDMKASIVIPTFERPGLAEKLKKQIEKYHGRQYEVIIVKSTGNTSITKNLGIKKSRGEVIIFFDDDVEITKKTIPSHLNSYSDAKIVGVAGRVINDGEKIPKDTEVETGKTNPLGTKFDYRFWSTKKQQADFVYGCNMSFRKSALLKIGCFDENLPKIFEEVDLSKRIKKFGIISFEPQALAYHHKAKIGGIRPEENINKQKLIFENYGYYLAKNVIFPLSLFPLLLRVRTAMKTSLGTIYHLLKGYFLSIIYNKPLDAVLPIIAFLRLWRVSDFFIFTFSEEWQGTLAWDLVKDFHLIWIGVSQANIGYYLGSGFIYFNYLLFLLGRGDPAVLAYFSVFLGLITVTVLYLITEKLFTKQIALFASLFYGCSTLINFYDRRFWNPSFIPLFSLLYIYSLIKADEDTRWYFLTAVLIGLSFHFHLLLLLFLLPAVYSIFKNFKKIKPATWIFSVAIYLFITFPLMVFDLNHNFDNLLAPYKIIFEGKKTGLYSASLSNILTHIQNLVSTLGRVWFLKLQSNLQDIVLETNTHKITGNLFLSALSIVSLIWFFLKNRFAGYRIFFLSLTAILLAYIFYPSYNPEYYLVGFLTILAIVIGFNLSFLPKTLSYLLIFLFISVNLFTVITATGDYGLSMRKQIIQKTATLIGDRSFELITEGPLPDPQYTYAGWRLLFKLYGKTPARSSVDSVLGWVYQDEISSTEPDLKVIISEEQENLTQTPLHNFKHGVYYVYIINNQ